MSQSKASAVAQAHENSTENPAAAAPAAASGSEQKVFECADSQETEFLSQFVRTSKNDLRPMRLVLIVLAAAALAWILLWWIAFA